MAVSVRDGVSLVEGGTPVLFYRSRPEPGREAWRTHYVHPLHSVAGAVITEDGPQDHLHQRGVYWAWRRILVDGVRIADGWVGDNLVLEVDTPVIHAWPDGSAQVDTRVVWHVPVNGSPTPIIEELSTIRAYPAAGGHRRIDFDIRLRGCVPVCNWLAPMTTRATAASRCDSATPTSWTSRAREVRSNRPSARCKPGTMSRSRGGLPLPRGPRRCASRAA